MPQPAHEHTWQLRGLTREDFTGAVPGEKRNSPRFAALGFSWRLQVAPNGSTQELAGGVGVFLQLRTADCSTPLVYLTLRIKSCGFSCEKRFKTSGAAGQRVASWGTNSLVTHDDLLDDFDAFAPDGVMEIQVKLQSDEVEDAPPDVSVTHDNTPGLAENLGALLASGAGADVTLVCAGGERLGAHCALLSARSPVFAAQLREGPMQADASAVPVPPEVTEHTLRQLLQFLYTDKLPETLSPEEATHLLFSAAYYDVPRLFALCERSLCAALSIECAADTLLLADTHNAVLLKNAALRFVAANALAVMATPAWTHLVSVRPPLVLEAMHTLAAGEPPAPPALGQGGDGADDAGDSAERRVRQRVH